MYFVATDIDRKCVEMTYIQTNLLGLCGEVYWGNSLTNEIWRKYKTVMTYSDQWQLKFFIESMRKVLINNKESIIPDKIKEQEKTSSDLIIGKNGQLKLFI